MWLLIFQGALHTYNTYTVKQKEKDYICAIAIHTYEVIYIHNYTEKRGGHYIHGYVQCIHNKEYYKVVKAKTL